jgi:hypothetical protein
MSMTPEQWGAYLAERMATCTLAAGAETNFGVTVYRGRRKIDDDLIPCGVLVEGAENSKGQAGRNSTVKLDLPFALHAYVPCDPHNPNIAGHAAKRDLKRAIFRGDPSITRLITYHGGDVAPRADGAAHVLVAIEISVEAVEDLAHP